MQVVGQMFDKRGIGPGAKSIGVQQVGLMSGPAPIQKMDFAFGYINKVFMWFVNCGCIHNSLKT